jgi:signal transduction histidine kinase
MNRCVPVFWMLKGNRTLPARLAEAPVAELLSAFLSDASPSDCFVSNLLHVGSEVTGFVLYGIGPTDERIYSALSTHISTALSGIFLTEHLENSFKRLVAHAHKEGMSHAASGLLHNIRNMLGSLTTTAQRLRDELAHTPVETLEQTLALLDAQPNRLDFLLTDPRAGKTLQLLLHLRGPLEIYQGTLHTLIEQLQDKNRGIRELLAEQPGLEPPVARLEVCDATSVMEEALALGIALSQDAQLLVERRFSEAFAVNAHPNKLLHALVNLVRNGCEAMADLPAEKRCLTVSLRKDAGMGVFEIEDVGVGLTETGQRTLFLYGETTKPEGHGIGLHTSANDITAMGGEITARSEGLNRGATFVVRLPLADAPAGV